MKKAILVIHGFVGSMYDNEYLMNYLEYDNRFKVFARTLPGHDKHDNYQKAEYTEWITFVESWIEEIISMGYKKIYVIGHSMGGILAGYLASKYKEVKKIVFLNAAFHTLNFNQNHSYLIASIGSSCAAFLAGYHPKKIPVSVHTAKLITMLHTCM